MDDILIELQEINKDNYEQCFSLDPKSENTDFVDSVIYSLAEAWVFYQDMNPFAICQNDKIIGFASMYVGEENYQIINFMIDSMHQHKGLGSEAAQKCISFLQQQYGATRISAPVNTGNLAPY